MINTVGDLKNEVKKGRSEKGGFNVLRQPNEKLKGQLEVTEKSDDEVFNEVKTWYAVNMREYEKFINKEYKNQFEMDCAYIKMIMNSKKLSA